MTKCYACDADLPETPVIAALSISEKDALPELKLASVNIVFDRVEVAFCSLRCARPRLVL